MSLNRTRANLRKYVERPYALEVADRQAKQAASVDRIEQLDAERQLWQADEWTTRYAAALFATGRVDRHA